MEKLNLIRVGIFPRASYFATFDYSIDIDGEPCNQLLVLNITCLNKTVEIQRNTLCNTSAVHRPIELLNLGSFTANANCSTSYHNQIVCLFAKPMQLNMGLTD